MSSFHLSCIAALTVAMVGLIAGAATAQRTTATDQSGKPYLAGLHPPHAHDKSAQKTSHISPRHKPTKIARAETKRRPAAAAKAHRPARLAEKINSRVAWSSVEPAAADERSSSETVLQFATEDTGSTPAAASRPVAPTTTISAPKIASPPKIAATDERDDVVSKSVGQTPPAAGTLVQTERFEAPASSQPRVILPAQSEAPATTSPTNDLPSARSNSALAPMLATLAGAITAGIAGWLMIGFASGRTIKSRQI